MTTIDTLESAWDNYDNIADARKDIKAIINEIKNYPNDLISRLENLNKSYRQNLIDDYKCPNCGKTLDWKAEHQFDTRVPFGGTYVSLEDGGHYECETCGFKLEE